MKYIKKIFYWLRSQFSTNRHVRSILVLGDSHAAIFNHQTFYRRFRGTNFEIKAIGGATASGLDNPNSKTQAYKIFRNAIRETHAEIVIVLLGEVDTGFVIWYRANKYQESIYTMLERAVLTFSNFMTSISENKRVICISAPLPTIPDGVFWGDIANLRREVTASQKERTELTLLFNKKIQSFCRSVGIEYVSLDNQSLDDNRLVKNNLLNHNNADHHYNPDYYSLLLADELSKII